MGPPRRFDPTAQTPHSSAQTTELNCCINPSSKVNVFFCKDVHGDTGSIFYGGQNTTLLGCRGTEKVIFLRQGVIIARRKVTGGSLLYVKM